MGVDDSQGANPIATGGALEGVGHTLRLRPCLSLAAGATAYGTKPYALIDGEVNGSGEWRVGLHVNGPARSKTGINPSINATARTQPRVAAVGTSTTTPSLLVLNQ